MSAHGSEGGGSRKSGCLPRAKKGMEVEGEPEVSRWSEVATAESGGTEENKEGSRWFVCACTHMHTHICT